MMQHRLVGCLADLYLYIKYVQKTISRGELPIIVPLRLQARRGEVIAGLQSL